MIRNANRFLMTNAMTRRSCTLLLSMKKTEKNADDARRARATHPSYKKLLVTMPPCVAAPLIMKITGQHKSRDIQPWKLMRTYDRASAHITGQRQTEKVDKVYRFETTMKVPTQATWVMGGVVDLIQTMEEVGNLEADLHLKGRNALKDAGIVDGYRFKDTIDMNLEIAMHSV